MNNDLIYLYESVLTLSFWCYDCPQEELAEGLHLIDFEQLKIENQTYNEKIEERNEVKWKIQLYILIKYISDIDLLIFTVCLSLSRSCLSVCCVSVWLFAKKTPCLSVCLLSVCLLYVWYVCLSILSLSVSLSVCQVISCLSSCLSVVCVSDCLFICMFVCLSVRYVCLSVRYVWLSVRLYLCLSVCQVCLFVCLSLPPTLSLPLFSLACPRSDTYILFVCYSNFTIPYVAKYDQPVRENRLKSLSSSYIYFILSTSAKNNGQSLSILFEGITKTKKKDYNYCSSVNPFERETTVCSSRKWWPENQSTISWSISCTGEPYYLFTNVIWSIPYFNIHEFHSICSGNRITFHSIFYPTP